MKVLSHCPITACVYIGNGKRELKDHLWFRHGYWARRVDDIVKKIEARRAAAPTPKPPKDEWKPYGD
jgi:hypothetical protein